MDDIETTIKYDFFHGESYSYNFMPYDGLYSLEELPGLYSWHIRIFDNSQVQHLINFFQNIQLDAEVSGNIRLKYEGKLYKNIDISKELFPKDIYFFVKTLISIGYPLYIGISKNLKERLNKHKIQFEKYLTLKTNNNINNKVDSDVDEESTYFGGRLASFWPKELFTNSLYVKYSINDKCLKNCDNKCMDNECLIRTWDELKRCEYINNTIFNPVFGRR